MVFRSSLNPCLSSAIFYDTAVLLESPKLKVVELTAALEAFLLAFSTFVATVNDA
jgi:hypothetical protein